MEKKDELKAVRRLALFEEGVKSISDIQETPGDNATTPKYKELGKYEKLADGKKLDGRILPRWISTEMTLHKIEPHIYVVPDNRHRYTLNLGGHDKGDEKT